MEEEYTYSNLLDDYAGLYTIAERVAEELEKEAPSGHGDISSLRGIIISIEARLEFLAIGIIGDRGVDPVNRDLYEDTKRYVYEVATRRGLDYLFS